MISLYYTSFDNFLSDIEFNYFLSLLPPKISSKALRFRQRKDAYACLFGKLLLQKGLNELGYKQGLNRLQYNQFGRPFLDIPIDFNISHSGSYVVCAFSTSAKVGVDLEKIEPVSILDFKNQWNEKEWNAILSSNDIYRQFFLFWTMKEAVIKADGRGLSIPLRHLIIQGKQIFCEGVPYQLKEIHIHENYSCFVASHTSIEIKEVKKVEISDFRPYTSKDTKTNPSL